MALALKIAALAMVHSPATKRRRRAEAAGPYPRPKGAAPHGAHGKPKKWDKENGGWHEVEAATTSTRFATWPSSMSTVAAAAAAPPSAAPFFPSLLPPPSQPEPALTPDPKRCSKII